jgi:hypothetical protein
VLQSADKDAVWNPCQIKGGKLKMMRLSIATLALSAASIGAVMAQDSAAFVGTWMGRTITGQTVQIEIPEGITQGQPVVYILNGQQQEAQIAVETGDRIRLNNSGQSNILLGPVKGNSMRYTRTNGQSQAIATLTKR